MCKYTCTCCVCEYVLNVACVSVYLVSCCLLLFGLLLICVLSVITVSTIHSESNQTLVGITEILGFVYDLIAWLARLTLEWIPEDGKRKDTWQLASIACQRKVSGSGRKSGMEQSGGQKMLELGGWRNSWAKVTVRWTIFLIFSHFHNTDVTDILRFLSQCCILPKRFLLFLMLSLFLLNYLLMWHNLRHCRSVVSQNARHDSC